VEAEVVEVVAVAEVVAEVKVVEAEVVEVEAVEEEVVEVAETPPKTRSYQPQESKQWAHCQKSSTETELWRTTSLKKSNNTCALTAT
jgi:hypothetical protein